MTSTAGRPGAAGIGSDASIIGIGAGAAQADQYTQFDTAPGGVHMAHDDAHGYIGGTIALEHFSFHDPFVFLLHSNVDRLLAAWQRVPGHAWRLDPKQVYGSAAASPTIVQDLQPWSGSSRLRPWAPPDNQQVPVNTTDLDVVTPVRYDVVLAGGALGQNGDGRVEVFVRGDDNALWHIWQTAPDNGWSTWASLGGNIPSLTA